MSNSKLQYPELDEARKAKLNEILEEIHTKASIDYSLQEMKDIQTAVRTMLERVVERVNKRGLFKISRIVPVGSMVEKTAVWKYNYLSGEIHTEFDYLGVLDCPRDILHRDQKCGQCVRLGEMLVKRNDLYEYENFPIRYNNDRKRSDHIFWREINTCLGSDCDCFSITLDENEELYWSLTYKLAEDCDPDYRCDKCVVEMPSGILRVNHSVSVGRAQVADCSLVFRWTSKVNTLSAYDKRLQEEAKESNSLTIHVDFLPAVEVLKSGTDTAAREHDFFLVPKHCNVCVILGYRDTWRKSNCLAEIAHIVNEMSEKHRNCYKVIKYFLPIMYKRINGYHVKTVVLNHSRQCSDSSEGCAECVLKILTELNHAYEFGRLNSFHDSNVNLYRILTDYECVIDATIEILCSVKDSDSCRTIIEDAEGAFRIKPIVSFRF